jgi:tetratricopeptide (TPR) repeat protein
MATLAYVLAGIGAVGLRRSADILWERAAGWPKKTNDAAAYAAVERLRKASSSRAAGFPWVWAVQEAVSALAEIAPSPPLAADALLGLGRTYRTLARFEDSLRCLLRVREIRGTLRNTPPENTTDDNADDNSKGTVDLLLASVYRMKGDWEEAERHLAAAETILRGTGKREDRARSLYVRGEARREEGRLQEAHSLLTEALTLYTDFPDASLRIADCRRLLGGICREQGDVTEALAHLAEALYRFERLGAFGHLAEAWRETARVYAVLGQPDQQALCLERARAGARRSRSPVLQHEVELDHAEIALARKEYNTALGILRSAHDGLVALSAARPAARAAVLLAEAQIPLGDPTATAAALQSALQEARAVKDLLLERRALLRYAEWQAQSGDTRAAERSFMDVLQRAHLQGSRPDQARVLAHLGQLSLVRGNRQAAETYFRQAAASVDALRAQAASHPAASFGVGASLDPLLYPYLRYLLQEKRAAEALSLMHQMKARALRQQLQETGAIRYLAQAFNRPTLLPSGVPLSEAQRVQQGEQETAAANAHLIALLAAGVKATDPRFIAARTAFERAEKEHARLLDGLYARLPPVIAGVPGRLPTVSQVLARLRPRDALLEFCPVSDTEIAAILAARETSGKILWHSGFIPKEALFPAIAAFQAACESEADWSVPARHLRHLLLEKTGFREAVLNAQRLYICPTSALWNLPFGALPVKEEELLVSGREIVLSYAGSLIAPVSRAATSGRPAPSRSRAALVVALSDFAVFRKEAPRSPSPRPHPLPIDQKEPLYDLPGTLQESRMIQYLYPGSTALHGAQATRASVLSALGTQPLVHLATHCLLNDAAPLYSSLVLHPSSTGSTAGPYLTARDLLQEDLSGVETTVLSACHSLHGTRVTGEGLLGFSWAVLAAGCPALIASPWKVSDSATACWMEAFYRALRAGKTRAASVREAALTTRSRQASFANPRHWAAFQLIGAA